MESLTTFVALLENKDTYYREYSQKVAGVCVHMSRKLDLPQEEVKSIYLAGILHDIGMLYVPDEIMQTAPEKLDADQRRVLEQHPVTSEKILKNFSPVAASLSAIRHHHEAYDGSGYPDGLQGDAIPLGARIMKMANTYVDLTMPRSWRQPLSRDAALDFMAKGKGGQFDPALADDFVAVVKEKVHPAKPQPESFSSKDFIKDAVAEIVANFKRGVIDLPVMPDVLSHLQELLAAPDSSAEQLARLVNRDAAIAGKLISVANSPIYRGSDKIASVQQAIARLGLSETRMVVNTLANKSLYRMDNPVFDKYARDIWMHSLACAYSSKKLADELGFGDSERYYSMGLMHDIGKVLLIHAGAEIFEKARERRQIEKLSDINMEDVRAAIQEHHTVFGSALMQRWLFPVEFCAVAREHDNSTFSEESGREVLVVSLANLLTRMIDCSHAASTNCKPEDMTPARLLVVDSDTLERIKKDTRFFMENGAEVF